MSHIEGCLAYGGYWPLCYRLGEIRKAGLVVIPAWLYYTNASNCVSYNSLPTIWRKIGFILKAALHMGDNRLCIIGWMKYGRHFAVIGR